MTGKHQSGWTIDATQRSDAASNQISCDSVSWSLRFELMALSEGFSTSRRNDIPGKYQ
jgi:hypothetical protein